ncbi:hypothetical protein Tco_0120833 [Tanacetum coccineum]
MFTLRSILKSYISIAGITLGYELLRDTIPLSYISLIVANALNQTPLVGNYIDLMIQNNETRMKQKENKRIKVNTIEFYMMVSNFTGKVLTNTEVSPSFMGINSIIENDRVNVVTRNSSTCGSYASTVVTDHTSKFTATFPYLTKVTYVSNKSTATSFFRMNKVTSTAIMSTLKSNSTDDEHCTGISTAKIHARIRIQV